MKTQHLALPIVLTLLILAPAACTPATSLTVTVQGNVYYVATDDSDATGDGSASNPCLTPLSFSIAPAGTRKQRTNRWPGWQELARPTPR